MPSRSSLALLVALVAASLSTACGAGVDARAQAAAAKADDPIREIAVTPVVSQALDRELRLPGELSAYEDVAVRAKVAGFVESIAVDVGSPVTRGQVMAQVVAPEFAAQRGEAEARVQSAVAQRIEAEAKLASDQAHYTRLKVAAATPGVVAGLEVEVAEKAVAAASARVDLSDRNVTAAEDSVRALRSMEGYLRITSPFNGIVTERNAHPGTLVGPSTPPLVRVQQVSRLRLAINIPEANFAGATSGLEVRFSVPAHPGQSFSGKVARLARAVDPKTRSMLVEVDVDNAAGTLAPGMFTEVRWPDRRATSSLFVPASAIATTTERTFVVRVSNGRAEWIDIRRGATMQNLVEVIGDLHQGDVVATRGTDELRAGMQVRAAAPKASS
jgi:RND family efflux transporter MFP subunit